MKTLNKFKNLSTFEKVQVSITSGVVLILSSVVFNWVMNGLTTMNF